MNVREAAALAGEDEEYGSDTCPHEANVETAVEQEMASLGAVVGDLEESSDV